MSRERDKQENIQTSSSNDVQKKEAPDWLIENITEASKNTTKIFLIYIGYLSYFTLSIFSTTDHKIFLDEAVRLPVIKTDVPLTGFLLLGPIIAIAIFDYLYFHLDIVKHLTNTLNKDYEPTEKVRISLWTVIISNDTKQTTIDRIRTSVVNFFLWYFLPIILTLAAIWYSKVHNPVFSYIFGMMPIVGTSLVMIYRYHYDSISTRTFFRTFLWKFPIICTLFIIIHSWPMVAYLIEPSISHINFQLFIFSWIVDGTILGIVIPFLNRLRRRIRKFRGLPTKAESKMVFASYILSLGLILLFIIIPMSNKGKGIVLTLNHQKLVVEPTVDYEQLYWGNFRNVHLEGAYLRSAILKRANLYNAHLQYAHLDEAVLEGANLHKADLRGASLKKTNLKGADLSLANFQDTNVQDANLQEANLRTTNITYDQLRRVKTLYKALLNPSVKEIIEKYYSHLLEKPPDES